MISIINNHNYTSHNLKIFVFLFFAQVINYSESRTAEDICEQSSKLITFIDLAGHHKYLRTTIFGLTGHSPDFAMLVIAGNAGVGQCQTNQLR